MQTKISPSSILEVVIVAFEENPKVIALIFRFFIISKLSLISELIRTVSAFFIIFFTVSMLSIILFTSFTITIVSNFIFFKFSIF